MLTGRSGRGDRMRPISGQQLLQFKTTEWPDVLWSPIGDNRTRPVDEVLL
jgi:hypothetical protein